MSKSKKSAIKLIQDQKTRALIKRLVQEFARPYFKIMTIGLVCMGLVALMSVATAKLIEPIINDIFVSRRAEMLVPITLMILGVFLTKGLASYGESVSMAYVGQRIMADVQKKMFARIIVCDLAFFHHTSTGELVSRFTNDIHKLNTAVTNTLTNIGKDSFMLIAFVIFLFYQNWFLASISFFVLPIAILPVVRIGKRTRKVSTQVQEYTALFTSLLTESFQGIRLIKSYQMELSQSDHLNHTIENIFMRTFKASRVRSASHPIMEFLGGAAIATVVIYGGKEVISGQQNPGAFFSFITALLLTYEPLKRLANLNTNLQEQIAAIVRVFKFLDLRPTIQEKPDASILKVKKGRIDFSQVSFAYDKRDILHNIDLVIPAGKTVALVGGSGAGKSTMLNLIGRFYEIKSGQILIDGHNIQDVTLDSLRVNMALVSQEIVLFDDTIRANIAFGKPDASADDIETAARSAAAHDFIIDLPHSYDTRIGEQGVRLSGGQRQRLSIARALLKDPPIILLDEPTSALDSASEQKVQFALKTLMKDRTTLIIAHRLATVIDADIIYVIEQGQVIASGSHQDLIQTNSRYADLCRAQLNQEIIGPSDLTKISMSDALEI
ncbi:MAG: ABC transporter ATP-binding protein [Janthinobacterium lividum]